MKRHFRIKAVSCLLLAFLLAAGGFTLPAGALGEEPARTVRQVQGDDGSVEIWELVGVFGSEDEAVKSVGAEKPKKRKSRKGKTRRGSKTVSYEWKLSGKYTTGVGSKRKEESRRWKKRSRHLKELMDSTGPYNQTYVQDNLGSAR